MKKLIDICKTIYLIQNASMTLVGKKIKELNYLKIVDG